MLDIKVKMADSLPGLVRKPEKELMSYWNSQYQGPDSLVSDTKDTPDKEKQVNFFFCLLPDNPWNRHSPILGTDSLYMVHQRTCKSLRRRSSQMHTFQT